MKIIAKSDVGLVRSTNEDAFFYKEFENGNFIAFICDGMGGHIGGLYAANTAIDTIKNSFEDLSNITNVGVWLYDITNKANSAIFEKSIEDPSLKGMGTTLTGIIHIKNSYFYAHVGDSRIYVYDEDEINQITTDHTLVNWLLHTGAITFKQSLKHPKRHVLTNALGIKKEVSVDIGEITLKPEQNLLICSDGLYNMLDNKKIHKIVNTEDSIIEKVDELLNKALQAGGVDNTTIILIEPTK